MAALSKDSSSVRLCAAVDSVTGDYTSSRHALRARLSSSQSSRRSSEGRTVLVLSHRRAHCAVVAEALRKRDPVVRIAVKIGGTAFAVGPGVQVIVGTTAAVAEGFGEPRLDTLVLATPTPASMTQAVGRILRQRSALPPLVVDFVDPLGTCLRQWARRRADYARLGHAVRSGVTLSGSKFCVTTSIPGVLTFDSKGPQKGSSPLLHGLKLKPNPGGFLLGGPKSLLSSLQRGLLALVGFDVTAWSPSSQ